MIENKYIICVDPYDYLNRTQRILKKIGFYKNRPKFSMVIFERIDNNTVKLIK